MENNIFLFVYGSLKKNKPNNHLLKNATFINDATTLEKYPLLKIHEYYPYLIDDINNGNYINGELYLINKDMLNKLDIFEGNEFTRKKIEVCFNINVVESQVYFSTKKKKYQKENLIIEW